MYYNEVLWDNSPDEPYTLEWWMHMHKLAIFRAHLNREDLTRYIKLANYIAKRADHYFGDG